MRHNPAKTYICQSSKCALFGNNLHVIQAPGPLPKQCVQVRCWHTGSHYWPTPVILVLTIGLDTGPPGERMLRHILKMHRLRTRMGHKPDFPVPFQSIYSFQIFSANHNAPLSFTPLHQLARRALTMRRSEPSGGYSSIAPKRPCIGDAAPVPWNAHYGAPYGKGKGKGKGKGDGKGEGKGQPKGQAAGHGKGGRPMDPMERHSRSLTRILRHSAKADGIPIDSSGWVDLAVLFARPEFQGLTLADVQGIVASCSKQRFCLKEEGGSHYIRANQGHSMTVPELELQPITSSEQAPTVVHGTYYTAWAAIQTEGLRRMKRQHIHFAVGTPTQGVISGMRTTSQVLIYLDVGKCLEDGIVLLRSANNVILSPGVGAEGVISPVYFSRVVDHRSGEELTFG